MTIALLVFIPELPRVCSRKPLEPASAWFFVGKYAMWLGIPFVRRSFYTARLCQATRYGSARLDEMHARLFIPSPHTQAEEKKNKKVDGKPTHCVTFAVSLLLNFSIRVWIAFDALLQVSYGWRFAGKKRFVSACLLNVTCTSVMQRNTHCKCSFVLGKRDPRSGHVLHLQCFLLDYADIFTVCVSTVKNEADRSCFDSSLY